MAHHLQKDAIVQLAANLFTANTDLKAAPAAHTLSHDTALAQFVIAAIEDLYNPLSSDSSNFERIASALVTGATQLEFVAREFRKRAEW